MFPGIDRLTFPLPADRSFDEIIDVRSPEEFRQDHISGAINLPVLYNEERARIGTQYKQESRFSAVKSGAALIYKNLSQHLESHFAEKPKDYFPLIYCWRGGQRSESMATVLRAIGWQAALVEGGYKAYRRYVIDTIEGRSDELTFHVINGLTGCGKTQLLHSLHSRGAQILDLENLANHKGSVFGGDQENPQPAQKRFETMISDQLRTFSNGLPVFVEAESPKIGRLNLPNSLWQKMRQSAVTELVSSLENRTRFLRQDYEPWLSDHPRVIETISRLHNYHSPETLEAWQALCSNNEWEALISSLLKKHYDQHYRTGGSGHYNAPHQTFKLSEQTESEFDTLAGKLIANTVIASPNREAA